MYRFIALAAMLLSFVISSHGAYLKNRSFDNGWRFSLDADSTALAPGYDDSSWRIVDLPHDWSVEGAFDRNAPAGNDGGYLPTGIGWYRHSFEYNPNEECDRVLLYFEGVYMNSEVWVNGHRAGGRPYGYSSFYIDIAPYLKPGPDNVIAVKVDNSAQKNCRWYSGSGIYRSVYYTQAPRVEIIPESMVITTPVVTADSARVEVRMLVENRTDTVASLKASFNSLCRHRDMLTIEKSFTAAPHDTTEVSVSFTVDNPALWSPDSPEAYFMMTYLNQNGRNIDMNHSIYGLRRFEYSADKGHLLNGKPIVLSGACVHHDNGILGARSYSDAEWRKARLLKKAGFNAVRTSHNPPAADFLDACDALGLIVIDEAFDGWRSSKTAHDYAELFDEWAVEDVKAMVMRDRNHPSILAWSIGNEIIERKSPEAVRTARLLAETCRRYDPTRPVTSALASWDSDWEIYDPLAAEHDITGYNYMIHKSESDHERVPSRVMWQTESYPRDAFSNWVKVNDNPYIIGDFVWTGIDYLGESGIGRYFYEGQTEGEHFERDQWPWHGSYCGDIDLIGTRKPVSHYRQALYDTDSARVYIAVREPDGYRGKIKETMWGVYPTWESWTWPGHEGKPVDVEVVSRCPKVRLYVNGQAAGEAAMNRGNGFRAVFKVPYEPGSIRAVGLDAAGKETGVVSNTLHTAGAPAAIRLTLDRTGLSYKDLAYVLAEIVDDRGNVVPDASNRLTFEVNVAGHILAIGSADMTSGHVYTDNVCDAWKGRALCVLKSGTGAGDITLRVTSPGLTDATATLERIRTIR